MPEASGQTLSGEIYKMWADGTGAVRLTDDMFHDVIPRWSPEGTHIAYMSNRDGQWDIQIMEADGSRARNLTSHPANDWDPTWSPDGNLIAFFSERDPSGVYIQDVVSGSQAQLTIADAIQPAWSPAGPFVAFIGFSGPNNVLGVADLTTGEISSVVEHPFMNEPAWSKDGSRLAFRGGETGPDAEIYILSSDGTGETQLTYNEVSDSFPSWSP